MLPPPPDSFRSPSPGPFFGVAGLSIGASGPSSDATGSSEQASGPRLRCHRIIQARACTFRWRAGNFRRRRRKLPRTRMEHPVASTERPDARMEHSGAPNFHPNPQFQPQNDPFDNIMARSNYIDPADDGFAGQMQT